MITVVVPAYNEEEVIEKFVVQLESELKLDVPWEILVVDDGSTDGTAAILERLKIRFRNLSTIRHSVNQNLGGALRTGLREAQGDVIITMDADLTHPPSLIPALLKELETHDVCVASRFVKGGGMLNVASHRSALSVVANVLFRLLVASPLRDNTSGFRAYRGDLARSLVLRERGFAVQLEIIARLLAFRATFTEVPFVLENRKLGVSKLNYLKALPPYATAVAGIVAGRWLSPPANAA
jgi:dolichol-phosphate mannosyltransferase